MRVITFGTYDVFHYGHVRLLERAKSLGNYLIVGVSTDALSFSKKQRNPVYSEQHRVYIVNSLKFVDEVFFEESLEKKREYILKYKADVLVMGDGWVGKFDEFNDICRVEYIERTPSISTTELIEVVRSKI